ncbi:Uncharacterised protein [Helicobacter pametensis]|nr:Uncharacterised protein [Helicobacter pametensis]
MRIILQIFALLIVGIIAIPIFGAFFETGYILLQTSHSDSQISQKFIPILSIFLAFFLLAFCKIHFGSLFWCVF